MGPQIHTIIEQNLMEQEYQYDDHQEEQEEVLEPPLLDVSKVSLLVLDEGSV